MALDLILCTIFSLKGISVHTAIPTTEFIDAAIWVTLNAGHENEVKPLHFIRIVGAKNFKWLTKGL